MTICTLAKAPLPICLMIEKSSILNICLFGSETGAVAFEATAVGGVAGVTIFLALATLDAEDVRGDLPSPNLRLEFNAEEEVDLLLKSLDVAVGVVDLVVVVIGGDVGETIFEEDLDWSLIVELNLLLFDAADLYINFKFNDNIHIYRGEKIITLRLTSDTF